MHCKIFFLYLYVCRCFNKRVLYKDKNEEVLCQISCQITSGRRIGRGAESMYVMVGHFMRPVIFEVNKSDIRATPQLAEAVNYIMDNKGSVIHIAVMGQASPEGPLKWNMKLGQSRAEALADYIVLKTGIDRDLIHIDNLGEDWERMECMLSGMEDFPNGRRILDIMAEEQDSETRKLKIRALDGGKTWRRLIDEVFPPSRNARMAIISACRKQDPIAPEIVLPQLQAVPLILYRWAQLRRRGMMRYGGRSGR